MEKTETYVIINRRGEFCCKDNLPYSNGIFFGREINNCLRFNSVEEIKSFLSCIRKYSDIYTECLSDDIGIEKITTEMGGIKEWY